MTWQNRVVSLTLEPPEDLLAHPLNPRRHPGRQHDVMRDSLDELGFAAPILVNVTTQHVLDGHLRVEEAITAAVPKIPVVWLDLTEEEESVFVAIYDPITMMAVYDQDRLDELMADIDLASEALDAMLAEIATSAGKVDARPLHLADELAEVRTVVLVLDEEQYAELWGVLRRVPGDTTADKVLHLARRFG